MNLPRNKQSNRDVSTRGPREIFKNTYACGPNEKKVEYGYRPGRQDTGETPLLHGLLKLADPDSTACIGHRVLRGRR